MAGADSLALIERAARGWRGYAMIALLTLAAALPGLAAMPVMDRDEARFVQATRQMLESRDFVRIRVQDEARNKKPIGIHWLQAAAVRAALPLTGKLNTIWPYRAPSVLAAIAAALAAFWGGAALIGRGPALLGAAMFGTGALLSFEAMTAKTDAALCAAVALAMAALARLRGGSEHPKALALCFWAAMGAGMLIKGPVAPIVVGLGVGALYVWERRAAWLAPLLWAPGPLLAAAIALPWFIAINLATGGAFLADSVGGDVAPKLLGGQEGHFALPGYHLTLLSVLIFPATLMLPAGLRLGLEAVRARPDTAEYAGLRFLIAWAAPTFVLFELAPTKLAHYPLPVYPALALIGAAGWVAAKQEGWRSARIAGGVLFAIGGAALAAVIAYLETFIPGDPAADLRRAIQAAILGAGIVGGALAVFVLIPRLEARAGAAIVAALALGFMLRQHVLPEARTLHVSAEAASMLARTRLSPTASRPLWVVGYREASLVFVTRTDIRLASPEEAGGGAAPGDALLIEGRDLAETEAALLQRGLLFTERGVLPRGLNYGNSAIVTLHAGVVETAEPSPAAAP